MKESLKGKDSAPHLKLGDFVRIKDAAQLQNMNEMAHVRDTLGEPPYVYLENAAYNKHFGLEVFIRSRDQKSHPVRVLTGEAASRDDAVNVYQSGVIQIPASFLEKVTPPRPELAIGRIVRINYKVLSDLVQPFQFEAIRGKFKDKECKVLRIVEADDIKDPTHTHYYALLGIANSSEAESIISVPIVALETVH